MLKMVSKMHVVKRILVVFVSLFFLLLCRFSSLQQSIAHTSEIIIDETLMAQMKSNPDEEYCVAIWITEIDVDLLEEEIKQSIGINREMIRGEYVYNGSFEYSLEDVKQYVCEERKTYAKRQFAKNLAFVQSIPVLEKHVTFVSRYAPMIVVKLTLEDIASLQKVSEDIRIVPSYEFEIAPEMDNSLPLIRAEYTRDVLNYSGNDIIVGIIEDGCIDKNNGTFDSSKITNYCNSPIDPHTTAVANIIASVGHAVASYSHIGIAPNVEIYCKYCNSLSNYYADVEWLLDQGVDVINMSAELTLLSPSPGLYTVYEEWTDHIALNHSVHFVKSAGNQGKVTGSEWVTHPGLAYNVITVGAVDDKNTTDTADDTLANFSSFLEESGLPNKPDLCAPGVLIATSSYPYEYFDYPDNNFEVSGTSFAAPHVTGIIAQLLDAKPSLIVLQDTVKAILSASVYQSNVQYQSSDSEFDYFGAGLVDARGSIYTGRHTCFANSYFSANCSIDSYQTFSFTVSSSDTMKRIALAWLLNSKISGDHILNSPTLGSVPDLDIEIYNPNGIKVGECHNPYNNLDVIQLNSPIPGTYTAKVICKVPSDKKTYFSVSWY